MKYKTRKTHMDRDQGNLMQRGWCFCLIKGHCRPKCLRLGGTGKDGAEVFRFPLWVSGLVPPSG